VNFDFSGDFSGVLRCFQRLVVVFSKFLSSTVSFQWLEMMIYVWFASGCYSCPWIRIAGVVFGSSLSSIRITWFAVYDWFSVFYTGSVASRSGLVCFRPVQFVFTGSVIWRPVQWVLCPVQHVPGPVQSLLEPVQWFFLSDLASFLSGLEGFMTGSADFMFGSLCFEACKWCFSLVHADLGYKLLKGSSSHSSFRC
jgi:hypothetical protein